MVARHFNEWIRYERNSKSQHTIASYKLALRLYIVEYLENTMKLANDAFDINKAFSPTTISNWLLWLKGRGYKAQSINHRRGSLMRFLHYLGKQEPNCMTFYLEGKEVQKHKVIPVKIHGFSMEALKALLNAPDTSTKTGYRDCVLFSLLYATGARINELLNIRLRDVKLPSKNGKTSSVTFFGKGNKYRNIPLLSPIIMQLKQYIAAYHGSNPSQESFLFFAKSKGSLCPLSQRAIDYRLKKYAEIAHKRCDEVPLDAHTHQFRHTRATEWIKEGHPLPVVSSLLGHASVETTMTYLDITPDMIAKATKSVSSGQANNMNAEWPTSAQITQLFDFG